MSDDGSGVHVTRPSTATVRPLRAGRGRMVDVAGPAQGSRLDIHVNELNADAGPGPYHLHTTAENAYLVLAGRAVIRLDGIDHEVGPGDAVFIPPGVPHAVSPVDGEPVRLIEIYAPAEPDFIAVEQGGTP